MPRIVPSDVVKAIDRMFPEMAKDPHAFPQLAVDHLPWLMALANLVEAVPVELVVLEPQRYAELVASVASLRAMGDVFGVRREMSLRLRGFDENPIALIRRAIAACHDEAPATETAGLAFVNDSALRDSVRLDISGANRDLTQGEWKGATVLAGSAVEALLLWKLQEHEKQTPGALAVAVAALLASGTVTRKPNPDPEEWHLHQYIEVALHLKLIQPESAVQARQAKDFRNLIHPGRATRLGQTCDRGTALATLAAVELIVRDLTPP